jgi:3-methylfumaryl-CoA hydratase
LPAASIADFEFKAVKPVFDTAPFSVHGRPEGDGRTVRLWARDADGALAMSCTARLA